jgi:MFS family permease
MKEVQKSSRTNLDTTLKISLMIKDISQDIMNLVSFVQLNRLALKHLLRNIDHETHAFEQQIFKDFLKKFYNDKDTHFRHFLEHPGVLRAYFQLKYLIEVIQKGLEKSKKLKDFDPVVSSKSNPKLYSYNNEMDEFATDTKFDTNVNDLNEVEFSNQDQRINDINENLNVALGVLKIQKHFFKVHKNNLFKQLGLEVFEYFNVERLNSEAHQHYTMHNLEKGTFIDINIQSDGAQAGSDVPKHCYSMLDLWLVYLHTFLYVLNYYGMAQTSPDYSKSLGLAKSTSGVLQAASPLAAIFFGFIINCITKRKYRFPYLLCLTMLTVGNFMYYIAETVGKSSQAGGLILLVLGRMIFGSGGSRLMTRKFIAINVPSMYQSTYSTYLVGFSALGITLGPGISSICEFVNPTKIVGTYLETYNILSLVFFFIWLFLVFFFAFFFKGYDVIVEKEYEQIEKGEEMLQNKFLSLKGYYKNLNSKDMYKNLNLIGQKQNNFYVSGLATSHLNQSQSGIQIDERFEAVKPKGYDSRERKEKSWGLSVFFPNDITFYSLWCFLVFKIVQEAYFTEQPQMLDEYYGKKSQFVGWLMLGFTLIGVPTALATGWAVKKYEDRKILLIGFILYIIGCAGKINYQFDEPMPQGQYYLFSGILFMASLIGESAAISILAKVISPSLKLGFLNAGLLSGTADTIGRALGNSSMTLFSGISGRAATPFYMYITYTILILFTFILNILFYKKIQKYSVITVKTHQEEARTYN